MRAGRGRTELLITTVKLPFQRLVREITQTDQRPGSPSERRWKGFQEAAGHQDCPEVRIALHCRRTQGESSQRRDLGPGQPHGPQIQPRPRPSEPRAHPHHPHNVRGEWGRQWPGGDQVLADRLGRSVLSIWLHGPGAATVSVPGTGTGSGMAGDGDEGRHWSSWST